MSPVLGRLLLVGFACLAVPTVAGAQDGNGAPAAGAGERELAQFQLPPAAKPDGNPGASSTPALPQRLVYEYGFGSESEAAYRRNSDLDDRLDDDVATLQPQLNGYVTYRPTDWLETKVELILEREMRVHGKRNVRLPSGETERRAADDNSLLVDQAFFRIHDVTDPLSFSGGRINYEDARHWLYDTSLDVGAIGYREGPWRGTVSYGREVAVDLDALRRQRTDRINTLMVFGEYRATADIKLAGYAVRRDDRDRREGRWNLVGVRSIGFPTESVSYWVDVAGVTGRDETSRRIRGYGFDVGATYRFLDLPFSPNVTLAYAYGSGDRDDNDRTNNDFRQTGLQSNEQKFAGLTEFRYYGEALDPELSNLKILTVGVGFRPVGDISVDVVYHRYWLDALAEELRNTALTAELNQDPNRSSDELGQALDLVVGFRNVFGVRRLGIDLRGGLFFPGDAIRNERSEDVFEDGDHAAAVIFKLWL